MASGLCSDRSLGEGSEASWNLHWNRLERSIEAGASSTSLHGRALARLLGSINPDRLELSERDLRHALALEPDSAVIRNDLALVLRLKAGLDHRAVALLEATELIFEALRIDPGLEAARFNLAHLLTELRLQRIGEQAWKVVEATGRPGWSTEARAARRILSEDSACLEGWRELESCRSGHCLAAEMEALCRERAAGILADILLPEWAELEVMGRKESQALLARLLAQVVAIWGEQEHFWGETWARLVVELSRQSDRLGSTSMARGILAYKEAVDASAGTDFALADRRFAEARKVIPDDSILSLLIRFESARSIYLRHEDHRLIRRRFQELASETGDLPWWRLRGDIARFLGLAEAALGFEDASRRQYANALSLYGKGESFSGQSRVLSSLVESDFFIGDSVSAWARWLRGMAAPGTALSPKVAYNLLDVAAVALWRDGPYPRLGLAITAEQVEWGRVIGAHNYVYQGHMRRAAALGRGGRPRAALSEIQVAREAAEQIKNVSLRARSRADLDLIEAEILSQIDPAKAIELLSSSLEKYRRDGHVFFEVQILKALAKARLVLGQSEAAKRRLEEASEKMNVALLGLSARELRMSYLDLRRGIHDLHIELSLKENPLTSLGMAERGRLSRRTRLAPEPGDRMQSLPVGLEGACLLYYRVLPEKLLIWSRAAGEWKLTQVPVSALRLRRMSRGLVEALERERARVVSQIAREVYAKLIEPVESCLRAGDALVLVPDSFLYTLPFAILEDRDGQLLVESWAYQLLPGLAWIDENSFDTGILGEGLALLLASPKPPAGRFQDLETLRHPEGEVDRISALFQKRERLLPTGLSKDAFLQTLAKVSVLHFAGHAVDDLQFPLQSALLIGEDQEAVVSAADLLAGSYPSLKLVFLSACRSMSGPPSGSAGAVSLARAFIDAGARAVVGSVTRVDDAATAELAVAFYRNLEAGSSLAEALRGAQLEAMGRGDSMRAWAGYSVLGSP